MRIRANFQRGNISNNPLTAGATTINSDQFAGLPEIVAPDYLVLTLDPESAFGAPEIVHVTAHAPAATTVTVTRGSAIATPSGDVGTASREHPVNTVWRHGATKGDADNLIPQGVIESIVEDDSGDAYDINTGAATIHVVTLDDDADIDFVGDGTSFTLVLVQDNTGGHTATFLPTILWAGGSPPALSTGADEVDVLTFFTTDSGTTWYGFVGGIGMA